MKTNSTISTFVPNKTYHYSMKPHHSQHIDFGFDGTFTVEEPVRLHDIETELLNYCLNECDRLPYIITIN